MPSSFSLTVHGETTALDIFLMLHEVQESQQPLELLLTALFTIKEQKGKTSFNQVLLG